MTDPRSRDTSRSTAARTVLAPWGRTLTHTLSPSARKPPGLGRCGDREFSTLQNSSRGTWPDVESLRPAKRACMVLAPYAFETPLARHVLLGFDDNCLGAAHAAERTPTMLPVEDSFRSNPDDRLRPTASVAYECAAKATKSLLGSVALVRQRGDLERVVLHDEAPARSRMAALSHACRTRGHSPSTKTVPVREDSVNSRRLRFPLRTSSQERVYPSNCPPTIRVEAPVFMHTLHPSITPRTLFATSKRGLTSLNLRLVHVDQCPARRLPVVRSRIVQSAAGESNRWWSMRGREALVAFGDELAFDTNHPATGAQVGIGHAPLGDGTRAVHRTSSASQRGSSDVSCVNEFSVDNHVSFRPNEPVVLTSIISGWAVSGAPPGRP